MKSLKEIILMFVVVIGLALNVSAQNDDQKRPPKVPPVREPKEKPPRDNPPKGGHDRPKKPGMSFYLVSSQAENKLG
ncbi:MAG: hypothetical protein DMF63_05570 [Acidobacteria bacterium]|nr:MAG: hypothetical protein DMF63_05570 [Acidobacteriota bacterium]